MVPSPGPSKIGKYDVEERVGEGAMGVVYRAVDPVLKRRVAIKVMSDAFAQNDDLRERFLREAQAAGSLQHPNVITIYDFGDVDGHPYIAMEFVEGQDVAELIAHQVPLSVVDKLDLAIGVLQGLAYAHKRGIVHRDIKPANIRVDDEGKARIMDFGVAHLASSNMTKSGVMLGTPSYMAPEQIVGGKVGPQTDIFSVGAVLYELLTGARPFEGGTLQAVMYRVLSENPAPLSTVAPGLPARLNDVVMRALAKDAVNRYSSALDMANDLIAIRAAMDASAASPGTLSLRATIESAIEVPQVTRDTTIPQSASRPVERRRCPRGGACADHLGARAARSRIRRSRRYRRTTRLLLPRRRAQTRAASVTTAPTSPAPKTVSEQPRPTPSASSSNSAAGNRTPATPPDRARNAAQNAPRPESNAAVVQSATRPQERVTPTQTPAANSGPPVTAPPNQPTQPAATTTAGSSQPVVIPPPAPVPRPHVRPGC